MEGTIGYDALFSSDEWDSMDLVPDDDLEVLFAEVTPDGDTVEATHSCTIYDPPGETAGNERRFEIECERCGIVGTATDRSEAEVIARLHEEVIPPSNGPAAASSGGENQGAHKTNISPSRGEDGVFEVECLRCGHIGKAESYECATRIALLHEEFVATLVDKWSIDQVIGEAHCIRVSRNDKRYAVTCSKCGDIGSADDRDTANLLARLHEQAIELASKTVAG